MLKILLVISYCCHRRHTTFLTGNITQAENLVVATMNTFELCYELVLKDIQN